MTNPDLAQQLTEYRKVYWKTLFEDCLPFWSSHAIDKQYGGYITALDRDGTVLDSDKSIWHQGRFAWLLATLYREVRNEACWLDWARTGVEFLEQYGFDQRDGRMWFHVTRQGQPLRKRRYVYSESFACIAFAQFAAAAGQDRYARLAEQTFKTFTRYAWEESLPAKFEPTRPAISIGYPMCTLYCAQQLRDTIQLTNADQWIDRSIQVMEQKFVKHSIRCVMETVAPDGSLIDHFEGRQLNPGHAIESAWFIMHEGYLHGDSTVTQLGCSMLDYMWQRGWDPQYGGLLYFVDLKGGPVQEYWHDMKFWWPHNEAIIATLYAYLVSGDPKYLQWHAMVHGWAFRHFADDQFGEWFGYLRRDGQPTNHMKGNLWKGPFHLPRMLLAGSWIIDEILRSQPDRQ